MARRVILLEKGPSEVTVGDQTIRVCRCGLTKNSQGICDDSCAITAKEDDRLIYVYNDKDEVIDTYLITEDEDDCCGDACGCDHEKENHEHSEVEDEECCGGSCGHCKHGNH